MRINIWCKPLKRKTPEGDSNQILLIDSNIWNNDKLSNMDDKIQEKFLLITLMISSCLVYNKKLLLTQQDAQFFDLFESLIKNILGEKKPEDNNELLSFLPYFLCVLRDFKDSRGEENSSEVIEFT